MLADFAIVLGATLVILLLAEVLIRHHYGLSGGLGLILLVERLPVSALLFGGAWHLCRPARACDGDGVRLQGRAEDRGGDPYRQQHHQPPARGGVMILGYGAPGGAVAYDLLVKIATGVLLDFLLAQGYRCRAGALLLLSIDSVYLALRGLLFP